MNIARLSRGATNPMKQGTPFMGSMEGLRGGSRADIQMNGSGYNKARNRPPIVTGLPRMKGLPATPAIVLRNNDYTNKIPTGSPQPRFN